MATDTSQNSRDASSVRSGAAARRSSALLIGSVAAVAGLVAAVLAGALMARVTEVETSRPEVDAELRFLPEDDESDQPLVGADRTGDLAPEDPFPMLDGGMASLADLRGKPVVVNFFASWCAPCKKEMPGFAEVHAEVGDEVTFLGMSMQDREDDTRALLEQTGVEYAVGRDPSGALAEELGVVSMPTTYFLDAEGRVVSTHAGELDVDGLRSQIAALTS